MGLQHLLPRLKRGSWSWSQWAALTSVLALVACAIVGLIVSVQHQERTAATAAADANLAASAARSVDANFAQLDRQLLTTIDQHQSLQNQNIDPQARNAAYFEALQREPYFAFIDVVDKDGRAVAGRPKDDNNWSTQDYFAAQEHSSMDALFIGKHFSTENADAVGLTVSRRMTDGNGNFAGLVVMGVRLSHFRALFDRLQIGPNQSLMLLRDDCTILLRLPFNRNTVGNSFPASVPFCASLPAWDASLVASDPVDHVERRFALRRVGTFRLVASVGTPTDGPFAEFMALWWVVAGGLTAAVGLLLWKLRHQPQIATDRFAG